MKQNLKVLIKGPSQINSVSETLAVVDISGRTKDINLNTTLKLIDKIGIK